ncbi:hypothetical protein HDU82_003945 [Entophlyctis luteolus]|nr:hypothetical protein HDU82_003945 [Entophlyctis luteolus]
MVANIAGCGNVTEIKDQWAAKAWGGQNCWGPTGNQFWCSAIDGCPGDDAFQSQASLIVCGPAPVPYTNVTLTVTSSGGNSSSPILYGLMFEDINNSGDGGIHGQLLQSNGFQGSNPSLAAFAAVGDGVSLSIDTSTPLSTAITRTLKVSIAHGVSGLVGFSNGGYGGVPVNYDTYRTSFWIRGAYNGTVLVELVGNSTGIVYGASTVNVTSDASSYSQFSTSFASSQSPDGNNVWRLRFDGAQVAGSSVWFSLPQLFPSTYYGRSNGLRLDVGNFLEAMKPKFLRFPGGNNLEGETTDNRWKWNETIGPIENRPGRQGDWGYGNSDALGLMEYLQWCEDMKLEPVLAVWAGFSLGGTSVTGDALTPFVQDTLDELEFLFGGTDTAWGSLRAEYGHPEPYNITMIEIGNEDFLACSTYAERFTAYYNAIHAAYPSLTLIASTGQATCLPATLPTGAWVDIHHYETPLGFVSLFSEFDNYARDNNSGVFIGEYATTNMNTGASMVYSNVEGAVAEAVYMIGLERNSDIVKMAAYAPLFEHFGFAEWTPNLIGLSSSPNSLTGSVSYYVQQMFAEAKGDTVLPVSSTEGFGPLYWVVTSTSDGSYITKLANYGEDAQQVTVVIPDAINAQNVASLKVLSGNLTATNLPGETLISPISSSVTGSVAEGWKFQIPAYSVAVMVVSSS